MTRARIAVGLVALLVAVGPVRADDRYAVKGLVLEVNPVSRTFVASIDTIPGFMAAMSMPFSVKDAKELDGVTPGASVEFTLIVDPKGSHAERIRVVRFESLEPDPLAARRLALLRDVARGSASRLLRVGEPVPEFRLLNQQSQPVKLSQFRGKVVALNFMYTTCQLPDFCLRLVNHFAVLQKRFANELGRQLIFLTVTFDPVRDQPDVLKRYAAQWKPIPGTWHFLTGPTPDVERVLQWFGVSAFPNEGLMDHSLHTVLIDRGGALAANIEGNQYASEQLADLIQSVLKRRSAPAK